MVRRQPTEHPLGYQLELPVELFNKKIDLFIDIFKIAGCKFLISESSRMQCVEMHSIISRSLEKLTPLIKKELKRHKKCGLNVVGVHVDNEFNSEIIEEAVKPATLHAHAANEHVGVIERRNRTVKERMRSIIAGLPCDKLPRALVIGIAKLVKKMLNRFPTKHGLCQDMLPASLLDGQRGLDLSKRRITLGACAQVWIGAKRDEMERSMHGIALDPSNKAGGYYFFSLESGRTIHSFIWEELPITDDVMSRVNDLADVNMTKDKLVEDLTEEIRRHDDKYIVIDENKHENDKDMTEETENAVNEENNENEVNEINNDETEGETPCIDQIIDEEQIQDVNNDENMPNMEELIDELENNEVTDDADVCVEDSIEEEDSDSDEELSTNDKVDTILPRENENAENLRRSLRNTIRGKEYVRKKNVIGGKEFKQVKKMCSALQRKHNDIRNDNSKKKGGVSIEDRLACAVNACFAQYEKHKEMSAKKGFREFGEEAVAAMFREFDQLDKGAVPGKPVVVPVNPDTLTPEQLEKALDLVNLIKEKRDGTIKGRSCANGSKQRMYLKEFESVSSPTVLLQSIIMELLMAACEGRKIISWDVPGAFLQGVLEDGKHVILKLKGNKLVEMMCEINPKHEENVRHEGNTKVSCLECVRAIYGCIEAALQWHKLFTEKLNDEGFELNPCDKCVANKVIDGKQCAIAWHVDDCLAMHEDQGVLDKIGDMMNDRFGETKINKGNEHTFLGMKIKALDGKRMQIDMIDQLKEITQYFEEKTNEIVAEERTLPAAGHIFMVNPDAEELKEEQSAVFHSVTQKLLCLEKRARPDIETATSFLMRRVSKSDKDDWKNLKRVLAFLKGTINDKRIIGVKSLSRMLTFIDSAHAVHDNMRSHLGRLISLGEGIIHGKSAMQKVNAKSTCESELVAMAEYLPHVLWTLMFMKAQGHEIEDNLIYQDNKSAMLLERNGRNSCTGNSRHINIRYFFIKDRIDKGEVRVEYLPMHLMLSDYYAKPLQGKLFHDFREYIMG